MSTENRAGVPLASASGWPPWEIHAYEQRQAILEALGKPSEVKLTVELGPATLAVLDGILNTQGKIAALTATVNELTAKLKKPTEALQDAVNKKK